MAIVGEEALSTRDKRLLHFAKAFEEKFVTQGRDEDRGILDTLQIGWNLFSSIPPEELGRLSPELKKKYYKSAPA